MLVLLWLACSSAPAPCEPPTAIPTPKAAGCFVVHNDRLLLVRNATGWSLPAGSMESGEDTRRAAERETLEEAGVRVRAGAVQCVVPSRHFVAHQCERLDDAPPEHDGVETFDARFMSLDEVTAIPEGDWRYPAQRSAYEAALRLP
jgi:8-oxo-dGTP pyrophosphatase MutT (NUDIX family)